MAFFVEDATIVVVSKICKSMDGQMDGNRIPRTQCETR